jgi:hypothetical protein
MPLTAVQTPLPRTRVPPGALTKHTRCALSLSSLHPATDPNEGNRLLDLWSLSRPLLAWSTNPIACFLRVFYTTARFLQRVFYTPGCPTNQYPLSSGCGGREQTPLEPAKKRWSRAPHPWSRNGECMGCESHAQHASRLRRKGKDEIWSQWGKCRLECSSTNLDAKTHQAVPATDPEPVAFFRPHFRAWVAPR